MAGRPTLTTDPSMKARLEARMVVASTIRGCSARESPPGPARAPATSQAGLRLEFTAPTMRPTTAPRQPAKWFGRLTDYDTNHIHAGPTGRVRPGETRRWRKARLDVRLL